MNKMDSKVEELLDSCEPFSIKMIEEPALAEIKSKYKSIFLPTNREHVSVPINKKARLVRRYIHVKMVTMYNYLELRMFINSSLGEDDEEW